VLGPGDLADFVVDRLRNPALDRRVRPLTQLSATYISATRPRTSSITGTAVASAASATIRLADSSSLVPRRCPATLITSSTRPRIRK
jgi:hypothetical protein